MKQKEKKPCKFAVNPSGDCWECTCYRKTYCADQIFDKNKDGSLNLVICGYARRMDNEQRRGV